MKIALAEEFIEYTNKALTYDDVQIVPQYCTVDTRSNIKTETRLVGDIKISHPLIPANMDSISSTDMVLTAHHWNGMCFLHRFDKDIHKKIKDIKILIDKGIKTIGISLGTSNHDMWVAEQIRRATIDKDVNLVFLIDVAHGHHIKVKQILSQLKTAFPEVPVIAGNVATYDGAYDLCEWGADGIKVGIGPGSLCSTRINTGAGIPQFSAVAIVRSAIDNFIQNKKIKESKGPTLIADGGIKWPGDIVKALGAGANSIMSGYLFAGTSDTPGNIILKGLFPNEKTFKIYRGSASRESKLDRGETSNIEGATIEIPFKGETDRIFAETLDGIKSGLSYAGYDNLEDSIGDIYFTLVSTSSITEAGPNALFRH